MPLRFIAASRGMVPMRLPEFLIIGAIKTGTTTLYHDLASNPGVFLSSVKEPGNLRYDEVMTAGGRLAYARLFADARPDQVCGEASTCYSQLPTHPGVPRRARQLLGPGLKVIYLVREPVARILSHHDHSSIQGRMPRDLDEALRRHPELIDYGRYSMQLDPWLETFGPAQVRVLLFERYVRERRAVTTEICEFLGVTPRPDFIPADVVFYRTEGRPVLTPGWLALRESRAYRRLVRPLLPGTLVSALVRRLFPKAPPRSALVSPETVCLILDRLQDDIRRLQQTLGLDQPPWDLERVRAKYAPPRPETGRPQLSATPPEPPRATPVTASCRGDRPGPALHAFQQREV